MRRAKGCKDHLYHSGYISNCKVSILKGPVPALFAVRVLKSDEKEVFEDKIRMPAILEERGVLGTGNSRHSKQELWLSPLKKTVFPLFY